MQNNLNIEQVLFEYVPDVKINRLYNQLFSLSEKTIQKSVETKKVKGGGFEGGLGNLIASLGLGFSLKGSVEASKGTAEDITYELTSEQKLKKAFGLLIEKGKAANLNYCLVHEINLDQFTVFVFSGVANFQMLSASSQEESPHPMVKVVCAIEQFSAEFFCSFEHFLPSSIMQDIESKARRNITGLALVKSVNYDTHRLTLNPLAF